MTRGVKTSEFWVTILTALLPVATLVWHRDFSAYVPAIAFGLAALAGVVYTLSRTSLKKVHAVVPPNVTGPSLP